ncbi:hypothetical protein Gogos_022355 [Gossypium gossypioides]|uniref:Uncharacterized protein n=1 Tax=Gossypium gossypioides TaxID=34282 RepID=A0A7J9D0W1_GOSGO|nr:hypothetical protein [Gossypium gossypioides]
MTTPEYDWLWGKRVNDNVLESSQENTRSIEEHLQVIPSELEIIKQDFEKRRSEDLLESRNKKVELRAQVAELERSLHQYSNRNSTIELKTRLNKIEEMKRKIKELEIAHQNCELRVELLKTNNEHWKEQL